MQPPSNVQSSSPFALEILIQERLFSRMVLSADDVSVSLKPMGWGGAGLDPPSVQYVIHTQHLAMALHIGV